MRFRTVALAGAALVALSTIQPLAAQEGYVYAPSATSKFGNIPGLPACVTGAVQKGDPAKTASVILAKFSASCKVPWHWHTAPEQLMMLSGRARVEMKDGSPATMAPGDYVNLPGKHVHQFTCQSACKLFIAIDGPFDIHYVDAKGNEIPQEQALKTDRTRAHGKH
jgi:quercetin dioxygenase-like cupin family protein